MSTKNSNKLNVPEAKAAMDQFKMEAASEVGVNLKNGYNGHLTSREAGSVGGQMVKKMAPIRTMSFKRADRTALGHEVEVRYIAGINIGKRTSHNLVRAFFIILSLRSCQSKAAESARERTRNQ